MAAPLRCRAKGTFLVLCLLAIGLTSCTSEGDEPESGETVPSTTLLGEPASFTVQSSVAMLIVTEATPGTELTAYTADDNGAASGTVDEHGQLILRDLEPGAGYSVATDAPDVATREVAGPVDVWAIDDVPDEDFYSDQEVVDGYQYLETRDGTLLAINVTMPGPIEDGPYPTVVEYSGYSPADPDGSQPSMTLAQDLGYATVGMNVRGTACSGGGFRILEPAQSTDGYDAIEVIARQPWVAHDHVGMVGLSYPGFMQLFVAQTNPPSLAAIAPMAVISDVPRMAFPGGIFNAGFLGAWAENRVAEAEPGGQSWSAQRIAEGDTVCEANQLMRSQNDDPLALAGEFTTGAPEDHPYISTLSPYDFVDEISMPVFLGGAFQDEQSGSEFASMIPQFTSAPVTRFNLVNGGHIDPYDPEIFLRWSEFLDLYVAEEVPSVPEDFDALYGFVDGRVFNAELGLPPDRFDGYTYEEALAEWEDEDSVRILFESGGGGEPGVPVPRFEESFPEWPVPDTEAAPWYFTAGGELVDEPGADGADSYVYDTSRSNKVTLEDGESIWDPLPDWDWTPSAEGTAVQYVSEPLDETLTMIGTGSADLFLQSTAENVDLQVMLTEVRPDGKETYVQSGWLRAAHRAVDEQTSTELLPRRGLYASDWELLPAGQYSETRVEIEPFAHVFREGSRIAITIDTPGGNRPRWTFQTLQYPDPVINTIGYGATTPSRIVLPVVAGIEPPDELPPCPSLRGQPCRDFTPLANTPG